MKLDDTYRKYAETVCRYLIALCGDPVLAEELTQETFFRAVKNADSYDGKSQITTWLCSIAKNAYFTHLKKQSRQARFTDSGDNEPSCEPDMLDRENCRQIYKAVHRLEEPYREIVLLRIHTDMNFAEIGEIFGKSENWARVTFYRGKEKLRKYLEL